MVKVIFPALLMEFFIVSFLLPCKARTLNVGQRAAGVVNSLFQMFLRLLTSKNIWNRLLTTKIQNTLLKIHIINVFRTHTVYLLVIYFRAATDIIGMEVFTAEICSLSASANFLLRTVFLQRQKQSDMIKDVRIDFK